MGPDGAAARSQSCLSFDVAVVHNELQPFQTSAQLRNRPSTTCHPHDILESTKNFTISHCNSSDAMEFGHAGVLNEGTVCELQPGILPMTPR